jgi:pantoate--beta-alanine ligase
MEIVRDSGGLRRWVAARRARGLRIGFVPTMGALHEGHLSLVRRAAELTDAVVASVFVNPAQFGPDEDYNRYPRDPDGDAALLAGAGCHLLVLPEVETLYPPGGSTWVDVEGPSRGFEADQRPGHFRGVATVVLKLFHLVTPDVAVFGRKDAQQLAVVRTMVRDLHLPVEVVGAPIVREPDGLAMSSRNAYLTPEDRQAAGVLHRALGAAVAAFDGGERRSDELRRWVEEELATEPRGQVDYVAVVDADTFEPVDRVKGPTVVATAVRFGETRLLDNVLLEEAPETD